MIKLLIKLLLYPIRIYFSREKVEPVKIKEPEHKSYWFPPVKICPDWYRENKVGSEIVKERLQDEIYEPIKIRPFKQLK